MESEKDPSNARDDVPEHDEHVIPGVPMFGGPWDGNTEDGLVSEGELCGKVYVTDYAKDYLHCYNLTYNNDDGFRFVYAGLKKYHMHNGDFIVEEEGEEEDGK